MSTGPCCQAAGEQNQEQGPHWASKVAIGGKTLLHRVVHQSGDEVSACNSSAWTFYPPNFRVSVLGALFCNIFATSSRRPNARPSGRPTPDQVGGLRSKVSPSEAHNQVLQRLKIANCGAARSAELHVPVPAPAGAMHGGCGRMHAEFLTAPVHACPPGLAPLLRIKTALEFINSI